MSTVTCAVALPPGTTPTTAARLLVEVRDVSLADAPSTVVVERVLEGVRLEPGRDVRVELELPEVEPDRSLSLRVHADLVGDGRIARGDLLSTRAHPVPPGGGGGEVRVPLTVV